MIGLACSALAAGAAWLVARREPRHRPIRDALCAATWHAGMVALDGYLYPDQPSPRAALLLWTLVALYSGWAYLHAWNWNAEMAAHLGVICVLLWTGCIGAGPAWWWSTATWGPFVASSVVGVWALGSWLDPFIASVNGEPGLWWRDRKWIFTQRIALILLISDVCMLAFIPWPGVQVWQGRVSAIVVAGMQLNWWWKNRRQRAGNKSDLSDG